MYQAVLQPLHPDHVGVVLCRADAPAQRRGWTSARDAMWSDVGKKAEPQWRWHAIDPHSDTVFASVFGRCTGTVLLVLQDVLTPCGITQFDTDGWVPTSGR